MSSLGTVADLIEYFNLNRGIFQKERSNKEHMERIMSMLTQQNMEILQKQFELYPKGLELPTFIYLMKKLYAPQNQMAKYYFVSDLIKFFQAIDINGDGHLEWSQFTQYIIQNIRRVERPNYKNKIFQQNQIISSAYSKISNEYKITKVIDPGTANCIKKINYMGVVQRYYVLESGSNYVRIFDSKFNMVDFLQLKGQSQNSFITDFALDKQMQIFCALFQGSAKYCNMKLVGNVKAYNQVEIKRLKNYHKVEYLPLHKMWAFLSKSGQLKLSTVSYKSRTAIDYTSLLTLKQHQSLITEITQSEQPLYIMTSSMDGTIKYYSNYLKKSIQLQHTPDHTNSAINSRYKKGVLGVDYTREFGSYVLSYGFSSSIYIYSLDISLVKGFTGKYNEHTGNLLTAKFLKSFPYVLSFDDKLNMRIWDFRRFQTIQIINCEKNFINPSKLQIIPQLSQCLVCQKKITQFRAPSLEKKSKEINQFHSIFDFKICSSTNNIFLFTSNDVRIYNYITGSLQQVFTKLTQGNYQTNITACQFGYKSRKFFVGDAGGFVREYCSQTGQFLQDIAPSPSATTQYQNKSIVKLLFLKEHSLLIVCSLDGRLLIYQRDSQSQFQLIRDIRDTHFELTCAAASSRYCTLVTGADDGIINLWDLGKLILQGTILVRSRVISVGFSPIHPILIAVEATGDISLFYIRPYEDTPMRNTCFCKVSLGKCISSFSFDLVINNYLKRSSKLLHNIPPQHNHHLLASVGCTDGSILLINFNTILDKYGIDQNHQIFTIKKSIKCQTHSMKTVITSEKKKILQSGVYSNDNAPVMELSELTGIIVIDAHKEPVDKVLLVKENSIIMSTSLDKKLKVWSFQGDLNGSIDFFTFKKINWKVAEMNFYKKLQAIDTTIYSMTLIENKTLLPLQQQFIRINLLINEYMSTHQKEEYIKWIGVLKRRTKLRSKRQKIRPSKYEEDNKIDVRDQIDKYTDVNARGQEQECPDQQQQQFNHIYNKLVAKIRVRLQSHQLPSIKQNNPPQKRGHLSSCSSPTHQSTFNFNPFKKELSAQQLQEKEYQAKFNKALKKKPKPQRKVGNMLYQSLVEVRKNIINNKQRRK